VWTGWRTHRMPGPGSLGKMTRITCDQTSACRGRNLEKRKVARVGKRHAQGKRNLHFGGFRQKSQHTIHRLGCQPKFGPSQNAFVFVQNPGVDNRDDSSVDRQQKQSRAYSVGRQERRHNDIGVENGPPAHFRSRRVARISASISSMLRRLVPASVALDQLLRSATCARA